MILRKQQKQAVREAATICSRPLQVDLWPFDRESGVRVTCDVGYLRVNFSFPRPLCSRLRPDVRDRQTSDVRQTDVRRGSSPNAPTLGWGIIMKGDITLEQWCSPGDQDLGLEAPRGQKWKSWSWCWIMKSWSWSWTFGLGLGLGLEEKVLQFFKTLFVIQQKQFAIRKPLFERTFCAPCTSASVERVFNLDPMYTTDRQTSDVRQTDVRRASSPNTP